MTKIVGIRFRNVGKIYYFDPKNYKMKIGDHVIVETARGGVRTSCTRTERSE